MQIGVRDTLQKRNARPRAYCMSALRPIGMRTARLQGQLNQRGGGRGGGGVWKLVGAVQHKRCPV